MAFKAKTIAYITRFNTTWLQRIL